MFIVFNSGHLLPEGPDPVKSYTLEADSTTCNYSSDDDNDDHDMMMIATPWLQWLGWWPTYLSCYEAFTTGFHYYLAPSHLSTLSPLQ